MIGKDENKGLIVVDGGQRIGAIKELLLEIYDATVHVGLRTIIHNAAIQRTEGDEETIEVPKQRELRASVAVARCLMPIKLRGHEIKAMRKILGQTMEEFAKSLDERTAAQTVSRWESDAQPMGGYAEKMLRLYVCEELQSEAPGIEYNAKMISHLKVMDPWLVNAEYEVPAIELKMIELKEQSGTIIEAWNNKKAA
ncbi:MAG: helix-turn-helix domain-containing protein [Rhizomicrobium sp.]